MMVRHWVEGAGFLAVAVSLHVAIWWQAPSGAMDAAGDGGDSLVNLSAITSEIADMLEAVDAPPEVPVTDAMTPPEVPAPAVAPPVMDSPSAPARTAMPDLPDVSGPGVALPTMPQRPPEPPKAPDLALLEPPSRPTPPDLAPDLAPDDSPTDSLPDTMARPTTPPPLQQATPMPETVPPMAPPPAPAPPAPPVSVSASPLPKPRPTPPQPQQTARVAPAPVPQAPPTSTRNVQGQAQQRAAGTGATGAAGTSGRNDQAGQSNAKRQDLMRSWGTRISQLIQRRAARSRGNSGTATIRLSIGTDGRLAAAVLTKSSGNPSVDEAALASVHRAGRFPKAPRGIAEGTHRFDLPVRIRN